MSLNSYRQQLARIHDAIAKLQALKGKAVTKAAVAGKKSLDAQAAARRTKQPSTVASKLREAQRYAEEGAKAQNEIGKIEEKIAAEHKKLVLAQRHVDQEEAKLQKQQVEQQSRASRSHEQKLRQIGASLAKHEGVHQEFFSKLESLSALPERIGVVFFASDPSTGSEGRLRLDEEVRSIQQHIRLSQYRDVVDFQSRWAVRPGDILQALNELKPAVVHFSGHGSDSDELVLQDDNGNPKLVSKRAIVMTIATMSDAVKLVFFNTCFSYQQAMDCVEHVPAAIGMNAAIGDTAARVFAAQFYSAIGFGKSIPEAFRQALAALMLEGIAEETTPQLYLRDGIDEEDLKLVRPLS